MVITLKFFGLVFYICPTLQTLIDNSSNKWNSIDIPILCWVPFSVEYEYYTNGKAGSYIYYVVIRWVKFPWSVNNTCGKILLRYNLFKSHNLIKISETGDSTVWIKQFIYDLRAIIILQERYCIFISIIFILEASKTLIGVGTFTLLRNKSKLNSSSFLDCEKRNADMTIFVFIN